MNVPGLQCLQGVERCCHFPLASLLLPTHWARSEPGTAPWQDSPSPCLGCKSQGWGCTFPFSLEWWWVPARSLARLRALHLPLGPQGRFKGRVLLLLSHALPSYLQHTAACPVCRGCPMPGAGSGSCSLLVPAVVLLLSKVTSSRASTELEGEGGAQLVRFHALGKYGGPLYLPYVGLESTSRLAQCLKCCWPGCQEG